MNRNDATDLKRAQSNRADFPEPLVTLLTGSVAVLSAGERALRSAHGITKNAVDSILRWNQYFDLKKEKRIAAKHSVGLSTRNRYPAPSKRSMIHRLGFMPWEDMV